MDHKTFSAYTLKTDQQQGIVESIVAVMGNDDQGDDVIHNGAFVKSIQERRGKIRVLDQHQTDSIMRAIGKPLDMKELPREQLPADLLARYPEATGGLYTKTQYLMDTPEGKGAFQRIAAGAVDEYSIGYDALDVDFSKLRKSDGTEKTVRNLRTIKLYEYSPVLFGMNSATQTLSIKGATGAAGLPLADRARAWDATGAEGRVRAWADATDAPNAKYRSAFFWYNSDAPDNFTSYKLQFADVLDGTLTAIPRGIFAVAAVLQGSRGGASIPQADQDAIKSKVSAYYAAMRKKFDDESIVPPWESKSRKEAKPWNVFHEGDKWNVYKLDADGNPTGDALGSHDNEADARAQVRALYASENAKAAKRWVTVNGRHIQVGEPGDTSPSGGGGSGSRGAIGWSSPMDEFRFVQRRLGGPLKRGERRMLERRSEDLAKRVLNVPNKAVKSIGADMNCIATCEECIRLCLDCITQMRSCPDCQDEAHQACIQQCGQCIADCTLCISDLSGDANQQQCMDSCQKCAQTCMACVENLEKVSESCDNCQEVTEECSEMCGCCAEICTMTAGMPMGDQADQNTENPSSADGMMATMQAVLKHQGKAGRVLAQRNADRILSAMQSLMAALADAGIDMGGTSDNTDNTDNAPAKRAATARDTRTQAGPSTTTPTDAALRQSLEIEIETLKLLEV